MDSRFTNRHTEVKIIKEIEDDGTIIYADGWCFGGAPEEAKSKLVVGEEYVFEARNFSIVTGMADFYVNNQNEIIITEWLWHKTDADLDREHAEMIANFKKRDLEVLEANREDWTRREAALPPSLRKRLERFRSNGGDEFDLNGWGYELIVCELGVLYAKSNGEDTPEIKEFAEKNGTSGNQHDYAKILSRHLTGETEDNILIENSVSALSPITGDLDYSGIKN